MMNPANQLHTGMDVLQERSGALASRSPDQIMDPIGESTPFLSDEASDAISETIPGYSAQQTQPILDLILIGGFANKMIQYVVARRIADVVEGCRISSNVELPEWGIHHPCIPGGPDNPFDPPLGPQDPDVKGIANALSAGTRVIFKSYAQWFPNFPDLDFCRNVFPADERNYPGYGAKYLVCNIRGAEVLDARHRHYVLLPVEFYADLAEATGLKLVFMGQLEGNIYCRALRQRFPDAIFQPSRGAFADFQTFRNSKNLVPAVSTFSWMAAWLSRAEQVIFPVNGLFHPVQEPSIDLLPYQDERYRFYLFPINYAVPVDLFEEAHRIIERRWRYVRSETIPALRVPRFPKRPERYALALNEAFYLQHHPDIAKAVAAKGYKSGLDHYILEGSKEERVCFPFDERWYVATYPMAALEVGQGDYVDFRHHYVEVGMMRGYKPLPKNWTETAEAAQPADNGGPSRLARRAEPIVDVHLTGSFADRMIQYIAVRRLANRIAEEVGGCRISKGVLPQWSLGHSHLPGALSPEFEIPVSRNNTDFAEVATALSSGEKTHVNFSSNALWFSNFPDLDLCRTLFPANQGRFPGFGPQFLVCNIEAPDPVRPHTVLLPIGFYAELARTTGLKLVFMGQVEDNAYCSALKQEFPDALFQPSRGPMRDFQVFRNSKNLVPGIGAHSWLAAWLSRADNIFFPVSGLFHPLQVPEVDLLPHADERYRVYLFPINYSTPLNGFEEAHQPLLSRWRYVPSCAVYRLRTPRWPKRLDRFAAMYDESFYLQNHVDVAQQVAAGGFASGLDHYAVRGFVEGRPCFALDDQWYAAAYPLAAFEVGQGDYADFRHHFVEVGAMRGYTLLPPK